MSTIMVWVRRMRMGPAHLAEEGADRAVCGVTLDCAEPLDFKPDESMCCHLCAVKSVTEGIQVAEVDDEDWDYL